jgi:hypothetical protein
LALPNLNKGVVVQSHIIRVYDILIGIGEVIFGLRKVRLCFLNINSHPVNVFSHLCQEVSPGSITFIIYDSFVYQ